MKLRKFFSFLLLVTMIFAYVSCTQTPESGVSGGDSSSSQSSESSNTSSSSSQSSESSNTSSSSSQSSESSNTSSSSSQSSIIERIVLFSDDTGLGSQMQDIVFFAAGNLTIETNNEGSNEGSNVLKVNVSGSSGWGGVFGIQLDPSIYNLDRDNGGTNVYRFLSGYIVFDVKIPSASVPNFNVTIENGTYPTNYVSKSVTIGNGTYGEQKDGNWHTVRIPINDFMGQGSAGNDPYNYIPSNLSNVASLFEIRVSDTTETNNFYIDRIYWER